MAVGCAQHTIFKVGGQCPPYTLLAAYSNRKARSCQCVLKNTLAKRAYFKCSDFYKQPDSLSSFAYGWQPQAQLGDGFSDIYHPLKSDVFCRYLLFSFFLSYRSFPARSRFALTRPPYRRPVSSCRFTLVADNQLIETVGRLCGFLFQSQLVNRP